MLETRAIIMQVEGQYALVKTSQPESGCEQCHGKGCGAGKLSRLFCSKPRQFKVENSIHGGVGDEVVISVAEGAVLRGIGLVYLLPLLSLVIGGMMGSMVAGSSEQQHDGYAVTGAVLGLACGFIIARWIALRRSNNHSQPYIDRQWLETDG